MRVAEARALLDRCVQGANASFGSSPSDSWAAGLKRDLELTFLHGGSLSIWVVIVASDTSIQYQEMSTPYADRQTSRNWVMREGSLVRTGVSTATQRLVWPSGTFSVVLVRMYADQSLESYNYISETSATTPRPECWQTLGSQAVPNSKSCVSGSGSDTWKGYGPNAELLVNYPAAPAYGNGDHRLTISGLTNGSNSFVAYATVRSGGGSVILRGGVTRSLGGNQPIVWDNDFRTYISRVQPGRTVAGSRVYTGNGVYCNAQIGRVRDWTPNPPTVGAAATIVSGKKATVNYVASVAGTMGVSGACVGGSDLLWVVEAGAGSRVLGTDFGEGRYSCSIALRAGDNPIFGVGVSVSFNIDASPADILVIGGLRLFWGRTSGTISIEVSEEVTWSGCGASGTSGPGLVSVGLSGLRDGSNVCALTARDAGGNDAVVTVTIVVDTIPPVLREVTAVMDGTTLWPVVVISSSEAVTISVTGCAGVSAMVGRSNRISVQLGQLAPGVYDSCRVEGRDGAGNVGGLALTAFTVIAGVAVSGCEYVEQGARGCVLGHWGVRGLLAKGDYLGVFVWRADLPPGWDTGYLVWESDIRVAEVPGCGTRSVTRWVEGRVTAGVEVVYAGGVCGMRLRLSPSVGGYLGDVVPVEQIPAAVLPETLIAAVMLAEEAIGGRGWTVGGDLSAAAVGHLGTQWAGLWEVAGAGPLVSSDFDVASDTVALTTEEVRATWWVKGIGDGGRARCGGRPTCRTVKGHWQGSQGGRGRCRR